ncbi:hypothetical protein LRH25_04885 [Ideonella azotifigens]|uniref:hypothetical protein n=1 Tax=Ideonella azotifigens TaxID=513160 RepID=UPI0011411320|nr:hypothetical protein [Ideonella azotifigens]MCD2339675.1 hypothetical protein [Ideonella azotifigens]
MNLSFYLAGVRFHAIDACNLPHRLDPVVLTREDWHRTPAFSVSTVTGSRLGHVPMAIALRLQGRPIAEAHLTDVDVHAVTWKRYTVALRALAEG